jgi:hypothetical protein
MNRRAEPWSAAGRTVVDAPFEPPPLRYLAGEACHQAERLLLPAALAHGRRAGGSRRPVVVLPGL